MKSRLFIFVIFAVLTVFGSQLVLAGGIDSFRPTEINVNLAAGADIATINARYRTTTLEQIPATNIYRLQLPAGTTVEQFKAQVEFDLAIDFAEPNYNYQSPEVRQTTHAFTDQTTHAFTDGNSPGNFFGQQPVMNLNLAQAQRYSRGLGVRVAVIDTGIDFNHPLFAGRIVYPVADFVDNDGYPNDELGGFATGHGTFVSGLIALTASQASIMPIRAFSNDGFGTSFNIAKSIRFATDNNAQIINMSFGLLTQEYLIKNAVDYASAHNIILVSAAGNDNADKIHFPAFRSNVLAVTSTGAGDVKAPFANFDSAVDVSAPGVSLYSAYPGNRWAWWSGTSFSTPLVAGEAALLLSLNPYLDRVKLTKTITGSGVNPDPFNPSYRGKLGSVRIDYLAAVNAQIYGQ